jgi:hypothetical protein
MLMTPQAKGLGKKLFGKKKRKRSISKSPHSIKSKGSSQSPSRAVFEPVLSNRKKQPTQSPVKAAAKVDRPSITESVLAQFINENIRSKTPVNIGRK